MKALILNAGQGRRLLPLTSERPKCLLRIQGRTILEWQVRELLSFGVDEIVTVVGFGASKVKEELERICRGRAQARTVYNAFFASSDNLVSCWAARDEMDEDFFLVNGDTLFEKAILAKLLWSDPAPVALAVDQKEAYDEDDMKVRCEGGWVRRIGKDLPISETNAESIGVLLFRGEGPALFRRALVDAVEKSENPGRWYLSVVDLLARRGLVRAVSVHGLLWTEIDYLRDLPRAAEVVSHLVVPPEQVAVHA
ncbi:MAG: nucleotidyltransferase [Candidatus Binatia bacterium]|nr:MAG: nucleotidyltransferase [Candidatus Binatia bacterium]